MEQAQNPVSRATKLTERHYGIDLLKILAMFFVVLMHTLGRGGILDGCTPYSVNYEISWFLEACAFCAVNCFALASGYIMSTLPYRFHRILVLWLEVVFYCMLYTVLFMFLMPGSAAAGVGAVSLRAWLFAVLPVTSGQYWYFSAYVGMFCFIPLWNYLLHALDRKMLLRLICTAVLFLSVLSVPKWTDAFESTRGYSMFWLSCLYMIGGYLRMYPLRIRSRYAALLYLGAVALSWAFKLLMDTALPQLRSFLSERCLITFNAPTMLVAAVCLLTLFSRISIPNKAFVRLIRFMSPLAFGVYLVHAHPLVWDYVLHNRLVSLCNLPPLPLAGAVLLAAVCMFLLCTGIDFLRLCLFRALRVPERCEALVCCVKRRLPSLGVLSEECSDPPPRIIYYPPVFSAVFRVGAMRPAHV